MHLSSNRSQARTNQNVRIWVIIIYSIKLIIIPMYHGIYIYHGRRCGFMVRMLDSGASGPGSSPGWDHRVVFLGKTLYSHSASLHPGV